jgi:chemotaxis protein methyltransferase CheR
MDLIFCRNVLMYFTGSQQQKVVGKLRHALLEDRWLVVSPSECSQALFSRFATMNFPGVILYRKSEAKAHGTHVLPVWTPPWPVEESAPVFAPPERWAPLPLEDPTPAEPAAAEAPPTPQAVASSLYEQGCYAEAEEVLLASLTDAPAPAPEIASLLARVLANQGKLADALAWCERWLAADKLDASGHYLRAMVLQELGDPERARQALQRAVYLDPNFVVAHFALGNLARSAEKFADADRHFANALRLLRRCDPDDLMPESEGLTAARLTEIIRSVAPQETAP